MGRYSNNKDGTLSLIAGLADTSSLANKTDISSIILTGTTNTSGGTITAGTWFYLNGEVCRAKTDIAANATFTLNTNYEKKSVGSALSELNGNSVETGTLTWTRRDNPSVTITTDYTIVDDLIFVQIWNVSSLKDSDWTIFDLTNSSKTFASLGHQILINDSNTYTGYVKGELNGHIIGIYRSFSGRVLTLGTLIARVLS